MTKYPAIDYKNTWPKTMNPACVPGSSITKNPVVLKKRRVNDWP